MINTDKNQRRKVLAAARVIHDAGVHHGWFGPNYKKSYDDLANSDPIGFDELNSIVERAMKAADALA